MGSRNGLMVLYDRQALNLTRTIQASMQPEIDRRQ
jgi:hypothetical protein